MDNPYLLTGQDQATQEMIHGSLYRCRKSGLDSRRDRLPEVTNEMREYGKSLVSGQIRLMRRSNPYYYEELRAVLDKCRSCLFYISLDGTIFGRYGNQALKDELKAKNISLGAKLDEKTIGTNAAVMVPRCQRGVWVIGEDHYIDAMKSYACYAFRIPGRYGRSGIIMLLTRVEDLTERLVELFRFIESTETIITAGLATEDTMLKDTLVRHKYGADSTEDMVLISDKDGCVTYANESFYSLYETSAFEIINKRVSEAVPELSFVRDSILSATAVRTRRVKLTLPGGKSLICFADCAPISNNGERLGAVITLSQVKGGDPKAKSFAPKYGFDDILGVSRNFVELKAFAERIAASPAPVLIQGESGTGKELFAHAIHSASPRWDKPFVSINCAAIPRDLVGSELFGYVGGAFTGSKSTGAKGKFELANGGTLFLDEIGEMPLEMQSVLLRVLEENAVTRIGGDKPIPVDVRLITATNRDLQSYIADGKFRGDLYYRINVVNLNLIPLRERREDVPVLAEEFIKRYAKENGVRINGIDPEALYAMMSYDWPGNIRELRNTIERCVITAEGGSIGLKQLPPAISSLAGQPAAPAGREEENGGGVSFSSRYLKHRRDVALNMLRDYGGNKSLVAKKMGISRSTLYRILNDTEE